MKADGFFQQAFEWLMKVEGGYSDNPNDPGGATKYGVTLKALREFHHNENLSKEDVFNLTLSQAQDFYFNSYWKPLGLEKCISQDVCTILLDQAVNRGVGAVEAQLRQLLDAKISPSFQNQIEILNFYESERDKVPYLMQGFILNFLVLSLKSYSEIVIKHPERIAFLRGWTARVANLFLFLAREPFRK